jgi:hypothetical protein
VTIQWKIMIYRINDNHPKLVCQFEFTAPDSPQQNGKVERKFATLYGRVQAMINDAELNWPFVMPCGLTVHYSYQTSQIINKASHPFKYL